MRHLKLRRSSAWIVLACAVLLTACGSVGQPAPLPVDIKPHDFAVSPHAVLIVVPSAVASVVVGTRDLIDFHLPPEAGHRAGGGPVTWPLPASSDQNVLRPTASTTCPYGTTCARFMALNRGLVSITAPAPDGIICREDSSGCVGITAAVYRIPVQVLPGAAPQVVRAGILQAVASR
jgi:hypothetical protein